MVSFVLMRKKNNTFADDNYIVAQNLIKQVALEELAKRLEKIIKWLKDSWLKVNKTKTELCIFHRKNDTNGSVLINGSDVIAKNEINVLGYLWLKTKLGSSSSKSNQGFEFFITSNQNDQKILFNRRNTTTADVGLLFKIILWLRGVANTKTKRDLEKTIKDCFFKCFEIVWKIL